MRTTINALSDLSQWKGRFKPSTNKKGHVSKTQYKAHDEDLANKQPNTNTKAKNTDTAQYIPFRFTLSQTNRLFELNKQAIERCKLNFPDHYHHKYKLAEECTEIAKRLATARYLIKRLKSYTAEQSQEQDSMTKESLAVLHYLADKFGEMSEFVKLVDENGNKLEHFDNKNDLEG
ncbi:hypothetical protein [Histophilus somni]|uniref:hypothetical protein n=1 Tax=Histophilus somni TaxID=731 RepID=UPI0016525A4F|nr:hypothetical protein [Histophilus somni]